MIQTKFQVRKTEKPVVHAHQLVAQEHPAHRADDGARADHDQRIFQIVDDDLPVREAERFEDRDLLALQRQQSRQHRVRHKRRHAQKYDRKTN